MFQTSRGPALQLAAVVLYLLYTKLQRQLLACQLNPYPALKALYLIKGHQMELQGGSPVLPVRQTTTPTTRPPAKVRFEISSPHILLAGEPRLGKRTLQDLCTQSRYRGGQVKVDRFSGRYRFMLVVSGIPLCQPRIARCATSTSVRHRSCDICNGSTSVLGIQRLRRHRRGYGKLMSRIHSYFYMNFRWKTWTDFTRYTVEGSKRISLVVMRIIMNITSMCGPCHIMRALELRLRFKHVSVYLDYITNTPYGGHHFLCGCVSVVMLAVELIMKTATCIQ